MRFGRRTKHRPAQSAEVSVNKGETRVASKPEGGSSNAVPKNGISTSKAAFNHGEKTSQRELRKALNGFLKEVLYSEAHPESDAWSDLAMNQLVLGLEIAIDEGWGDVVEALTDTGRVLQTYEDGEVAGESVALLTASYELIARMVNELGGNGVSVDAMKSWRKHYQESLMAINAAGLNLAHDGDDENVEVSQQAASPSEAPLLKALEHDMKKPNNSTNDLPTLEELPALEDLVDISVDAGKNHFAKGAFETTEENSFKDFEKNASETLDVAKPVVEETTESYGNIADRLVSWLQRESPKTEETIDEISFLDSGEEPLEVAVEHEAEKELPQDNVEEETFAPPQIVVELLDRLSDQLNLLEQSTGDEQSLALERLEGAVRALKSEAARNHFAQAESLCEDMGELCTFSMSTQGELHERFVDVAFAFGGAYMEAVTHGDLETSLKWKDECNALLDEWTAPEPTEEGAVEMAEPERVVGDISVPEFGEGAPTETTEEILEATAPGATDNAVLEINLGQLSLGGELNETKTDYMPATAEGVEQPRGGIDQPGETGASNAASMAPQESEAALAPLEIEAFTPIVDVSALMNESSVEEELPSSSELLQSAQRAAAEGNGTSAKFLALQAAASIAREESLGTEQKLKQTELGLRHSMESTEGAREQVKAAEGDVMRAATEVSEGESSLGSAQNHRAQVVQKMQQLESGVAELSEQIRALEAKKEAEHGKMRITKAHHEDATNQERKTEESLRQLRATEDQARVNLEERRQEVKNQQRSSLEIESKMEAARELLTQQRGSLVDIQETIEHLSGIFKGNEKVDSLLF